MKNRIEVERHLGGKPERRLLASGITVTNVRLAETYTIKRTNGNTDRQTNWHNLVWYGEIATAASQLEKGAHLHVVGWIEPREWTGKDGSKRTVWELNVSNFHVIAPILNVNGKAKSAETKPVETKAEVSNVTWPV